MGNLNAESALRSDNLQDSYSRSLGLTDAQYTQAVDNGTYTNFAKDCAGYGLAQWTYHTRKQKLLNFAKSKRASIGDLQMQLQFLMQELSTSFPSVLKTLKSTNSVFEASNIVLLKFECPADQSKAVQDKRAKLAQNFYDTYAKGGETNIMGDTYTKGSNIKLNEYFSSSEFDCHGRGCCSTTIINPQLIVYLTQIRKHFGKPITITSGYRCPIHNRNVGGATGSRHGKGDAADIVVSGIAPRYVAAYAESIGVKGIGLYETSADGHFVHIDTRSTKSFWYGQGQAYRSTFSNYLSGAGSVSPNPPTTKPPVNNSSSNLIKYGDTGPKVKELQEKLIALNYSCGIAGADGSFGLGTLEAVKKYQKDSGLLIDGIVGPDTMKKLEGAHVNSGNKVKITASILNVRADADINAKVLAGVRRDTEHYILEEKDGWGRIADPDGWISLSYTEKV